MEHICCLVCADFEDDCDDLWCTMCENITATDARILQAVEDNLARFCKELEQKEFHTMAQADYHTLVKRHISNLLANDEVCWDSAAQSYAMQQYTFVKIKTIQQRVLHDTSCAGP